MIVSYAFSFLPFFEINSKIFGAKSKYLKNSRIKAYLINKIYLLKIFTLLSLFTVILAATKKT